jgi:hypothetical protein
MNILGLCQVYISHIHHVIEISSFYNIYTSSVSPGFAMQIMPILFSLCYNGRVVTASFVRAMQPRHRLQRRQRFQEFLHFFSDVLSGLLPGDGPGIVDVGDLYRPLPRNGRLFLLYYSGFQPSWFSMLTFSGLYSVIFQETDVLKMWKCSFFGLFNTSWLYRFYGIEWQDVCEWWIGNYVKRKQLLHFGGGGGVLSQHFRAGIVSVVEPPEKKKRENLWKVLGTMF